MGVGGDMGEIRVSQTGRAEFSGQESGADRDI